MGFCLPHHNNVLTQNGNFLSYDIAFVAAGFMLIGSLVKPYIKKLVDIKIHKTDKVYFMNFDHLGIERKNGDDMFEQIWFIFENGYVLELTTDHCDYTEFSEIPPYVYYDFIKGME